MGVTEQPNTSRHNQIPHGTTKYLTAQSNTSRHKQIVHCKIQIINRKTKNFHGKSK